MRGTDVSFAAQCLSEGKLVVIPTETVYGLAANGLNTTAVVKIFEAKKRPRFNPLILHTNSVEKIHPLVKDIPKSALKLAEKFWPGPLSLLLPKRDLVPDLVTAGSPFVVVRIPNHPLTLDLLSRLSFPIAAPSANLYQQISPTNPLHLHQDILEKTSYVLEGGNCNIGLESTIIGFEDNQPIILREGGITSIDIQNVTGIEVKNSSLQIKTPGSDKVHYSTQKKLILTNHIQNYLRDHPISEPTTFILWKKIEALSLKSEDVLCFWSNEQEVSDAAIHLYDLLHQADANDTRFIIAEIVPNEGIGVAINDRLKRAAHVSYQLH
jgi:L-threonylcarbamoyladenylate synthase